MSITLNGTEGITLDNGSADGAQVTLASSGYSNWNLDNYSGRFRAYYNATEYFTINSSGNVGIGTSSPNISSATTKALTITSASGQDDAMIEMTQGSTIYGRLYSNGNGLGITGVGGIGMRFYTASTFAGAAERMRIDSSGNVLVGTTSAATLVGVIPSFQAYTASAAFKFTAGFNNASTNDPGGIVISYTGMTKNTAGSEFIYCNDTTALRMSVRSNGGIANYQANNANLSDERTKTDIVDAGNYLDKICAIPVRTFKYKDQTDDLLNLGVIAQEVEKVAPELVDDSGFGEVPEDGIPLKAIYQTDLQYALMKCIQEQQELIKALTSRIETLEAK